LETLFQAVADVAAAEEAPAVELEEKKLVAEKVVSVWVLVEVHGDAHRFEKKLKTLPQVRQQQKMQQPSRMQSRHSRCSGTMRCRVQVRC
jgi:hypothetical protein